MTHRWILPILLILFVSAACAPAPNLLNPDYLDDDSLLSGEPCESPCWNDLIPGETTWEDAQAYIEGADFTDVELSQSDEEDVSAEAMSFGRVEGQPCCYIYSETAETVDRIWLLLSPEIALDQVLEKYGEPEYIQAEDFPGEQALIALLYPEIPLVVYVYSEPIETGELTETSQIIGALYLSQEQMDIVLENENLYNWQGTGNLAEIIDGEFDVTAEATEAAD